MKKTFSLLLLLLAALLIIGACGKKESKDSQEDPTLTTKPEHEGGSVESGDGFGFNEFDLEIEVDGEDIIDISYDVSDEADAKYVNTLKDVDVTGEKAMDETGVFFENIRAHKDGSEDELVDDILQYFGIEDYSKFDLEINFDDDIKREIKRTN